MNLLLAAEEAAHGPAHAGVMEANWLPAVTALVVFLIAFGFLYLKVWPRIIKGLDEREEKIRREIRSAEEAQEQAKEALAQYERELGAAREEATALIARAKADAKAAAHELRERNTAELAEMKQRAMRDLDAARNAAIVELHNEAAVLASEIAAKILKREITLKDQERLVEESLEELAGATDH